MKLILETDLQYLLSLLGVAMLVYHLVNEAWKRRTQSGQDWKGKERD